MLEKTSVRLMPIINEVIARMVKEKDMPIPSTNHYDSIVSQNSNPIPGTRKQLQKYFEETDNSLRPPELDMRTLLGYLN